MTKSSPLIATSLNFESKKIRRIFHQDEWWFSVIDVVGALTESSIPKRYWADLKKNLLEKEEFQPYEKIVQFKMLAEDNKLRETDCANTQTMLRIIQSIPSPKAEPFKMWLAQVGFERIQEIENPELAQKRTREIYKAKGYPDSWIEKRMRGIQVREELTGEWQKRGVKESSEFSILTAEISKSTFGLTPNQHKDFKGLKRENLRDHMNDLELIFSMLGEAATTEIARNTDARGFGENKVSARKGGTIAGNARKDLEKQAGKKVVTKENFVGLIKD